jgi:hypothetical protein
LYGVEQFIHEDDDWFDLLLGHFEGVVDAVELQHKHKIHAEFAAFVDHNFELADEAGLLRFEDLFDQLDLAGDFVGFLGADLLGFDYVFDFSANLLVFLS